MREQAKAMAFKSVEGAGAYAGAGRSGLCDPLHPGAAVLDRMAAMIGRLDRVEVSTKGAIEALIVRTEAPVGLRTVLKRVPAREARVCEGRVVSLLSRAEVYALPDAR
jgi:hypothetical protein